MGNTNRNCYVDIAEASERVARYQREMSAAEGAVLDENGDSISRVKAAIAYEEASRNCAEASAALDKLNDLCKCTVYQKIVRTREFFGNKVFTSIFNDDICICRGDPVPANTPSGEYFASGIGVTYKDTGAPCDVTAAVTSEAVKSPQSCKTVTTWDVDDMPGLSFSSRKVSHQLCYDVTPQPKPQNAVDKMIRMDIPNTDCFDTPFGYKCR